MGLSSNCQAWLIEILWKPQHQQQVHRQTQEISRDVDLFSFLRLWSIFLFMRRRSAMKARFCKFALLTHSATALPLQLCRFDFHWGIRSASLLCLAVFFPPDIFRSFLCHSCHTQSRMRTVDRTQHRHKHSQMKWLLLVGRQAESTHETAKKTGRERRMESESVVWICELGHF